jgi:hypothetical protein
MRDDDTAFAVPYGYCQCGCGNKTDIAQRTRNARGIIKGQPTRFIHGHSSRAFQPNYHVRMPDGSVRVELSQDQYAVIDAEDWEVASSYRWYAWRSHPSSTWYAASSTPSRRIYMHRLLAGNPKGLQVDHKDGSGLNNRRSNLRIATSQQNQQNRGMDSRNTSGFKGVKWNARRGHWVACIRANGKDLYLGSFKNAEDAARAYDAAARTHFGEFVAVNFPTDGERGAS